MFSFCINMIKFGFKIETFSIILQCRSCVPPNYMENQQDINERMRGILIDWLIEV